MEYYVCLDVGGTNIRGSWADSEGKLGEVFRKKRPVQLEGTKEVLVELIRKIISDSPSPPIAIGVASAGPLDYRKKIYLKTVNMRELDFFPIGKFLEDTFSLSTIIENDAQAAAMGEVVYGCLKGENSAITITLGTGVGSGVILNGRIWRASHITGPELGHLFLGGDFVCGCGQIGCAETMLNKRAILRICEKEGIYVKGIREMVETGIEQREKFIPVFREYGIRLGLFISQLQVIFGIKNICISGGLVHFSKFCREYIVDTINYRLSHRKWWLPDRIEFSKDPDLSAILGMAAILKQQRRL